jgi:hypothetical protein
VLLFLPLLLLDTGVHVRSYFCPHCGGTTERGRSAKRQWEESKF